MVPRLEPALTKLLLRMVKLNKPAAFPSVARDPLFGACPGTSASRPLATPGMAALPTSKSRSADEPIPAPIRVALAGCTARPPGSIRRQRPAGLGNRHRRWQRVGRAD